MPLAAGAAASFEETSVWGATASAFETAFPLTEPVVVHQVEGPPQRTLVELTGREGRFAIDVPTAPVSLAVDPESDLV